jgi:putative peptide zinc metalloprotease protein
MQRRQIPQLQTGAQPQRLPLLREDLTLSPGPIDADGLQTWRIYDGLRHRFIAIDFATCTILSLWREHTAGQSLAIAATLRLARSITVSEINDLALFLERNSLTQADPDAWRTQTNGTAGQQPGMLMLLVHNYLFFKVPLFAPERFLHATSGIATFGAKRSTHLTIALLGLIGLLLVSRQWDDFLSGARNLTTAAGLAQFAITLFCVKILHEFGHAYAAVRFGCRVPVIGIAFMMMAPVLYTDVSDAWRLTERRKRFIIDAAGVGVELALACLATFFWAFLPDGMLRQTAFLIATSSWVMSVGINLNPFMRFDGYYIFADILGIENLQARSFDLGVWKLREVLLGLNQQAPETFAQSRQRLLIGYAWSVWLYRLLLFTGIAAAVYAYFFKALGIVLFLFEIGYFVVKPIVSELTQWWAMRDRIMMSNRARLTMASCMAITLIVTVPWSSTVTIPAVLAAAELTSIYPPRAAQITAVHVEPGQSVRKGDPLIRMVSSDLYNELRTTSARLNSLQMRLGRLSADKDDRDDSLVLQTTLTALRIKLDGLTREKAELEILAPVDGLVAELSPHLQPGQWLAVKDRIALLRSRESVAVSGYVAEADLWRIEIGASGRFVPDMPQALAAKTALTSVAISGASYIEPPELVASNGGRIDANVDARQRFVPVTAQYLVTLSAALTGRAPSQSLRGVVILEGRAESIFASAWRRVLKVLVRESAA